MAAGLSVSLQGSPYERSQIPYRLYKTRETPNNK